MKKISRRSFLKVSGTMAAAGALAACGGSSSTSTAASSEAAPSVEAKAVEGVNVTLGLPIIRASVDHGTDFYHAGKGNGNELSLVNAIKYAVKMTGREA